MEHYVIRVSGEVPDESLSAFGDITISAETSPQSILQGDLPDQASLAGVLEYLEGVGVQIIEVLKVPS